MDRPDAIIVAHQRSGTHFLLSCLQRHPRVHGRGEFVLNHARLCRRGEVPAPDDARFRNRRGCVNVGIVMYNALDRYVELCGPLREVKVIHLLRRPSDVARSVAQLAANRRAHGADFPSHHRVGDAVAADAPLPDPAALARLVAQVQRLQAQHAARLAAHPAHLRVAYEDLTGNEPTAALSEAPARRLLDFLGLPYEALRTTLRKNPRSGPTGGAAE